MIRRLAAALVASGLALTPVQAAEAPDAPQRLDDPIFRIGFKPNTPFSVLTEAVQQGIARRPGLMRYVTFEAKADPALPPLVLPGAFTGTFEQLMKTIACLNDVAYRDLSPSGVTFVPATAENPMPRCPREDTYEEMLEHARQPLPGEDFSTVRQRMLKLGKPAGDRPRIPDASQ